MKQSILKRILFIAIILLILTYFGVTLFRGNLDTDKMIDTEIAASYSYNDSITADAVVVRDETLIEYDGSKVLYYTVNDGDIVSVGSDVAYVFSNEEDALNYNRIRELTEDIETLESLNVSDGNIQSDYSAVDKQIDHNLKNTILAVNSNLPSEINTSSDNLVYSINQRKIITGEITNFDDQIALLQSELAEYESLGTTYSDVITTDKSGYFVSFADGYESKFDYATITDMTVDNFSIDVEPDTVSENTIGKIVSGLNWYVVVKVSADDALLLSHSDKDMTVSFPESTCNDIPATLVSLNQASKKSEAVAVFKCNYMNTPISHLRTESVKIDVNSYSGIRISKDAVHFDYINTIDSEGNEISKNVQGVYVLIGSELKFKEIDILYSGTDFVIANDNPPDGAILGDETVQLNDEVVIQGEELYDGKIVK